MNMATHFDKGLHTIKKYLIMRAFLPSKGHKVDVFFCDESKGDTVFFYKDSKTKQLVLVTPNTPDGASVTAAWFKFENIKIRVLRFACPLSDGKTHELTARYSKEQTYDHSNSVWRVSGTNPNTKHTYIDLATVASEYLGGWVSGEDGRLATEALVELWLFDHADDYAYNHG